MFKKFVSLLVVVSIQLSMIIVPTQAAVLESSGIPMSPYNDDIITAYEAANLWQAANPGQSSPARVTPAAIELRSSPGVFYYEDFGAVGDGVTDDFDAIIAAHEAANLWQAANPGQRALVRATPGATYYIGPSYTNPHYFGGTYRPYSSFPAVTGNMWVAGWYQLTHQYRHEARWAVIQTDVDWNTANFIIDDRTLGRRDLFNDVRFGGARNIFLVESVHAPITISNPANFPVYPGMLTYNLPGINFPALVLAENTNHMQFGRTWDGLTLSHGGFYQNELFLIDQNGVIDQSGPVVWDFTPTSITVFPVDEIELNIRGGNFNTVVNRVDLAGYIERGIIIHRSNVTLEGINHILTNERAYGTPENTGRRPSYSGFFAVEWAANTVMRDISTMSHQSVTWGSYSIHIGFAINLLMQNVVQSNPISILPPNPNRHGVINTDWSKNIVLNGVRINRFDAHRGITNLTILNSTLGNHGINLVGCGLFYMNNTTVTGRASMITLRPDYGLRWEGEVVMRNNIFYTTSRTPTLFADFGGVPFSGTLNHGYSSSLPLDIIIDGLDIRYMGAGDITDLFVFQDFLTAGYNHDTAPFPLRMSESIAITGLTGIPRDNVRLARMGNAANRNFFMEIVPYAFVNGLPINYDLPYEIPPLELPEGTVVWINGQRYERRVVNMPDSGSHNLLTDSRGFELDGPWFSGVNFGVGRVRPNVPHTGGNWAVQPSENWTNVRTISLPEGTILESIRYYWNDNPLNGSITFTSDDNPAAVIGTSRVGGAGVLPLRKPTGWENASETVTMTIHNEGAGATWQAYILEFTYLVPLPAWNIAGPAGTLVEIDGVLFERMVVDFYPRPLQPLALPAVGFESQGMRFYGDRWFGMTDPPAGIGPWAPLGRIRSLGPVGKPTAGMWSITEPQWFTVTHQLGLPEGAILESVRYYWNNHFNNGYIRFESPDNRTETVISTVVGETVAAWGGVTPYRMGIWWVNPTDTITMTIHNEGNANTWQAYIWEFTYLMPVETTGPQFYTVTIISENAVNYSGYGNFLPGTIVNINAGMHNDGWNFVSWSSTPAVVFADATSEVTSFEMPASNVTVTANRTPPGVLMVVVNGSEASDSGAGYFDEGGEITIHAGERTGYSFVNWTFVPDVVFVGGYSAAMATTSFIMPDTSVIAMANWERSLPSTPQPPTPQPPSSAQPPSNDERETSFVPAPSRPSAPAAPLQTITVNDGVSIGIRQSNNQVTLLKPNNVINQIVRAAVDNTVTIDLSGLDNASQVNIPLTAVRRYIALGLDIEILFRHGSITVSSETLQSMTVQSSGTNLSLTLLPVSRDSLQPVQRGVLPQDSSVYRVLAGSTTGRNITEFDGSLSVTVPYDGKLPAAVWHLSENGVLTRVESTFSDANTITFTTSQLSLFVAGLDAEAEETVEAIPEPQQVLPDQEIMEPMAADEYTTIRLVVGNTDFSVNGVYRSGDAAPFIDSDYNRTMVPARLVVEALGADIRWVEETRTVVVERDDITFHVQMDTPLPDGMGTPVLLNGRAFLPIAYVSQMLGAEITNWCAENQAVYIRR